MDYRRLVHAGFVHRGDEVFEIDRPFARPHRALAAERGDRIFLLVFQNDVRMNVDDPGGHVFTSEEEKK
jgi:hypothetical protein